jgi:hypothetical protein
MIRGNCGHLSALITEDSRRRAATAELPVKGFIIANGCSIERMTGGAHYIRLHSAT